MNNREWAVAFWLLVLVGAAVGHQKTRSSLGGALRALVHPQIFVPMVAMAAYVAVLVGLGRQLGLWNLSLMKGTIIWFMGGALVLFFRLDDATRKEKFFRRTALRTMEITVLVEFFLNLFVLSLVGELILQPVLMILVMVSAYSAHDPGLRPGKILVDRLLAGIGMGLAVYSLVQLGKQWETLDPSDSLLQIALPVWMTLGLLPFIYVMSVYVTYDGAFRRVNVFVKDQVARRRAKIGLVLAMHVRTREISRLPWSWHRDAAATDSVRAARRLIRSLLARGDTAA